MAENSTGYFGVTLVKRSQGKKLDLALVSGSANDLVIWSRERGDSRAPQLILIYK